MTNYNAVVLENKGINDTLKEVSILPISEDKVVALVITSSGHVENKTIDIKNSNLDDVKKIVELINKLIVGTPINEVSSKLEFEIKPIIGEYIMNYEMVYSAFYNAFNDFKDNNQDEVIIKGRDKILQLPEFNNVNDIKKVISALDEEKIKHLKEESEDINIYIGKENELDENLSVIKTKIGDSTLAIVGPKRMDYDFVVGLMEYIKNNIER
jgi:heat-inducible transcriptional repressor